MKKPEDIPQATWDRAGAIHSRRNYRELISRVLMDERERAIEDCILAMHSAGIVTYQEQLLMLAVVFRKLNHNRP